MNRSIVIFVALVILVAHSLAIRIDTGGDLAPPYDQAFVAFRIARNLVFEGDWSWSPGRSGFDSYPSSLWVIVCAAAERINFSINTVVRVIGVLATASSFILSTRFHPDRAASLITPMLLAISGAMASAAVSGTETAIFTAFVTASFLAFERRWEKTLAVTLLLCGLTRGEGWILAVVFLLLRLRDRSKSTRGESDTGGSMWPFLGPVAGLIALTSLRVHLVGYYGSPWFMDLIDLRDGEVQNGLAYLRDFFVSSASPALIVYAFWYLLRRNLSQTGKRALVIFIAWTLIVILQGGGNTPFSESMVPILPLTLIAGQEGLITALGSTKTPVRRLAWASFLVAVLASTLASFRPNDIGPVPLGELQREWMHAQATPRFGFDDELGRLGLDEEAAATRVLRDIAIYMRDQVDPQRSVLTPWPGSIAYLSSLPVLDLLGRTTPAPPHERTSFSPMQRRVDVLAALEQAPDYIVPYLRAHTDCPTTAQLADQWLRELDSKHEVEGRGEVLRRAFEDYEMITVPLKHDVDASLSTFQDRAYLLRKRSLGLSPRLVATLSATHELEVNLEHNGHHQLGDLSIRAVDSAGETWYMAPTGKFLQGKPILVRPNLLLTETGERQVRLLRTGSLQLGEGRAELHITLLNSRAIDDSHSMRIAEEVVLNLR